MNDRNLAWALSLILLGTLTAAAPAQQATPPQPNSPLLSLDYQGGNLKNFVHAVKRQCPTVNIVTSELAEAIAVPAMSIKKATVTDTLLAVSRIVPQIYRVELHTEQNERADSRIYSVAVRKMGGATVNSGSSRGTPHTVVFSLAELTEDRLRSESVVIPAKTILTAIDTGLSVSSPRHDEIPTIRYHEESGLLFFHGMPPQAQLVDSILSNLESRLMTQRNEIDMARRMGRGKRANNGSSSDARTPPPAADATKEDAKKRDN